MTSVRTSAVPGRTAAPGPRVLLLVPARTYRAADFLLAAARMGLDLVVGSDGALPLGGRPVIPVSPADPDGSARRIVARSGPVTAVIAADTPMLVLAAAVAAQMGLHNPVEAVLNTADKDRQRQRWAAAGVAQPRFAIVPAGAQEDAVRQAAEAVGFPCVVKAVSLSGSQGILRAGDPAAAVTAARRIRQVLEAARHPAVHAELRIADRGGQARPCMLELAARSIGGLCSRALRFPGGKTLITGLTITIPAGQRVLPLPDGDQYLGFIFAEAGTRRDIENALTTARDQLRVVIE